MASPEGPGVGKIRLLGLGRTDTRTAGWQEGIPWGWPSPAQPPASLPIETHGQLLGLPSLNPPPAPPTNFTGKITTNCFTWRSRGEEVLASSGAFAKVTHNPQRVSPLNRPAKAITPSRKQHARGTGSHSTPERLKQRDAVEVSDGRLYSLTFRLLMYRYSLERSCCLCKKGSCTDCTAKKQRGWGISLSCHAKGLQKKTYIHTYIHTHTLYTPGTVRSSPTASPRTRQSRAGDITPHGVPLHQQPQRALLGSNPRISIMLPSPQNVYCFTESSSSLSAPELCFSPSFISFLQSLASSC